LCERLNLSHFLNFFGFKNLEKKHPNKFPRGKMLLKATTELFPKIDSENRKSDDLKAARKIF